MSIPNGIRTESMRTPNASRAGALQHQHQSQHQRQNRAACGSIHRYGLLGRRRDAWMAADAAIGGGR